jgi:MFS family permease
MTEECKSLLRTGCDEAWPLYGAAFATGLSLSIAWTAMPFVIHAIGGTEVHVGYAPALNSLAYMVALLVAGSLLGHLDVKRATQTATAMATVGAVLMVLAVVGAVYANGTGSLVWVWIIIAAGALGGAAMALYWPFLMSWVSGSYEGVALNRRFGRYNGSWSGGGLVGPLIGGWLVEIHLLWPMIAAVACFVVSFVLLGLARRTQDAVGATPCGCPDPSGQARGPAPTEPPFVDLIPTARLADFRWMSRIALFCTWASFSIARSQFALLFTGLGFSKSRFGLYLTTIALCNFLALTGCGRWAFWHFRAVLLLGAQAMTLVSMFMILYGRTLGVFYLSAIVLGLAFGFAYSSHLYYGAATSRNRSIRMAIHEIVISLGIVIGAGAGGYLAKNTGPYAPYWFAVALVTLGGLAQLTIHLISQARLAPRPEARPAPGIEPTE